MRLNKDQCKHVAGVIDKVAIAYFAVVGYTAWNGANWLMFVHALVLFGVIEWFAILVLRDKEVSNDT